MTLTEKYAKRIKIAESVYSGSHRGQVMDSNRKLMVATALNNVNKFLNEAFSSADATQRSAMGDYKKFCLNLTNVALPNLIAPELVITHPMTSMTGYVAYIEYTTGGKQKGETAPNTVLNNPFRLGDAQADYTSSAVVESVETFTSGTTKLAWLPVAVKADGKPDVRFLDADGAELNVTGDVQVAADGTVTATVSGTVKKIAYRYDNVVIPQNDLPVLKAEMKSIPLLAKARRIAVYYSQIAAFQAKTDYGFDLGDQLAEKAVGELQYEIDTEVVNLLEKTADENAVKIPAWSRTLPVGVSKREHYAGFAEQVEIARQVIYDKTKRFAPNWMVISSSILPVLTFIEGFKAAPATNINGPYFAGTLNSLKVYVSPSLATDKYLIGVNGSDMMSAVAVYAPYMPIVPTSLLQFADGGNSQGFSTLYDLKVLNPDLVVEGTIVA